MPTKPFKNFCVISYVKWLVEDLRHNTLLPVTHDLGLDLRIPEGASLSQYAQSTAFWVPMPNAARLIATTGHNPFTSLGAAWLQFLPSSVTKRKVATHSLWALKNHPNLIKAPAHIKPADVKVPALPAQVYRSYQEFYEKVAGLTSLPESTIMQVSEVVDYRQEVRCFVTDSVVTAASVYLHKNQTWDAWDLESAPCPEAGVKFAQAVAKDLPGPRGYVLDVGVDASGEWSVVEANPSWSSNPYHGGADGVVASVCAAQHPDNDLKEWGWEPAGFLAPHLRRPLPIVS